MHEAAPAHRMVPLRPPRASTRDGRNDDVATLASAVAQLAAMQERQHDEVVRAIALIHEAAGLLLELAEPLGEAARTAPPAPPVPGDVLARTPGPAGGARAAKRIPATVHAAESDGTS